MSERISRSKLPEFKKARGIVFDFDGVLVDTRYWEHAQANQMLVNYKQLPRGSTGETVSLAAMKSIEQRKLRADRESYGDPELYYKSLLDISLSTDEERAEFHKWHKLTAAWLSPLITPTDGSVALLEAVSRSDKVSAGWTSRDDELIEPQYGRSFLLPRGEGPRERGYFNDIMTANTVGVDAAGRPRIKPDSTGLQLLAEKFDIPPEQWLMVGDRPSDMMAAKKLGAMTIAFIGAQAVFTVDELMAAGADMTVDHLSKVQELLFPE